VTAGLWLLIGLLTGLGVAGTACWRWSPRAAVAVDAADASEERARELARDVSRRIRERLEVGELLDEVVRSLGAAMDVDNVLVRLAEPDGTTRLAAQWVGGRGTRLSASLRPVLDGDVAQLRAALRGSPSLAIPDTRDDDRFTNASGKGFLGATRARSMLVAGIGAGDSLLGSITLIRRRSGVPFKPADTVLAESVGYALARGLQAADVHRQQRDLMNRMQELDRSKSEFVSSVSHELRTPLTSIAGYAEMLMDGDAGPLTDDQREMLDVMSGSIDRLQRLIEDLLTIGRIESERMQLTSGPVSVEALLHAVDATMRPQAKAAGLTLEVIDPETPFRLMGDRDKLEQVLLNLLSNAIKFTPRGGEVTLRARQSRESVTIEVSDTGIGIPRDEVEQMFSRFYRASNAVALATQGAGLGLSIVKGLVEAQGGTVLLRSSVGEGTRVSISMPRAGAEQPVERPALTGA
jgi:two-component system, OmpR family, phosphate regulon sensor histidine kinase PhoR